MFTGLRLSELLGLQWHDVDLHESVLHVRRQWTRLGEYAPPKTKAALRRLTLSDDMTKHLAALKLRSRHSIDTAPVFAAATASPSDTETPPAAASKPPPPKPASTT